MQAIPADYVPPGVPFQVASKTFVDASPAECSQCNRSQIIGWRHGRFTTCECVLERIDEPPDDELELDQVLDELEQLEETLA